eukprot:TRINITY_DN2697_c0_g1_i4.p1 TRINITY_DN2697_c0_g1~~TRINITY_DN2697_c0_g1_i4.p1  ORF type:complete len:261 (-),score=48.31 TRINITY_DN2697_c0_g1_i4:97-879(-)
MYAQLVPSPACFSLQIQSRLYGVFTFPHLRPNGCRGSLRSKISLLEKQSTKELQALYQNNEEEGPIELPQGPDPFEVPEASPLQKTAGVLLTGAITFLLYRSLKRRAKRTREQRFRSPAAAKDVRSEAEEALKELRLKQKQPLEVKEKAPPSVGQALAGAVIAGAVSYVLYNFSVGVESALNQQELSSDYSVRQITITIRTIIIGVSYLATFIFAANTIGLILYSGQLALNSLSSFFSAQEESKSIDTENKAEEDRDDKQ